MRRLSTYLGVVLAVALIAVGAVGWWQARSLDSADGSDNLALVDTKATSQVQSEVAQGLEQVLSYDWQDPRPTQQAADRVLAGDARREYDTLFAALQKQAPGQKLVLTAQVASVGVEQLSAREAKLLVFVDQSSRRAADKQASVSAAQLAVTARKDASGAWTLVELSPL